MRLKPPSKDRKSENGDPMGVNKSAMMQKVMGSSKYSNASTRPTSTGKARGSPLVQRNRVAHVILSIELFVLKFLFRLNKVQNQMREAKNQEFCTHMQVIMEMKDTVEHMPERSIQKPKIEKIERIEAPVKELTRAA